jgi:hypothetical protein
MNGVQREKTNLMLHIPDKKSQEKGKINIPEQQGHGD